ncbi:hypothetical protein KUCAC02_034097, partial [Chaenocephalus aceratus]
KLTHTPTGARLRPHMHILYKSTRSHGNRRPRQTTPCTLFRGVPQSPIHNFCAQRLLCPRASYGRGASVRGIRTLVLPREREHFLL